MYRHTKSLYSGSTSTKSPLKFQAPFDFYCSHLGATLLLSLSLSLPHSAQDSRSFLSSPPRMQSGRWAVGGGWPCTQPHSLSFRNRRVHSHGHGHGYGCEYEYGHGYGPLELPMTMPHSGKKHIFIGLS